MRHLTLAIALALLSGCLFAPSKTSSAPRVLQTIEIAGLNQSVIVSASTPFDLIVSGPGSTVTIASSQRVRNVTISGQSADVFIGSTSSISGTVTVSGANATMHLPAGSTISVNVTGLGAAVFYDSSAG